jgi:8-oxo-dGTP diphosphatase
MLAVWAERGFGLFGFARMNVVDGMKDGLGSVIPYKIAVLVYVFDGAGRVLLLHRRRPPNKDLYSPIGGKLETGIGESPYACALREIEEEIGVRLTLDEIRLMGIVSEKGFGHGEDHGAHWLMFCFEVVKRLEVEEREFEEGRLEWVEAEEVALRELPKTDLEAIWPLVREHSWMMNGGKGGAGVFSVHIDCMDSGGFVATVEWPRGTTTGT